MPTSVTSGARLGPYQLGPSIGVGGMGEVYRARDSRLGRDVAIKILPAEVADDPDRLRRFELEARAAASLNHPNILSVHDVGTDNGVAYLVTELLEGRTLRDVMAGADGGRAFRPGMSAGSKDPASVGRLALDRALDYAVQIADGLAAAHARGIVHRDLKPENIFVTTDGRLKILDFGLAKVVDPLPNGGRGFSPGGHAGSEDPASAGSETVLSPTPTASGVILGTVGYMAPEQIRGQAVDARTDIFAFGCVLYEMLAGRRAFEGDTPFDTLSAILKDTPAPLVSHVPDRAIPPQLNRIVERCLEKSPAARFQSTMDLSFALKNIEPHMAWRAVDPREPRPVRGAGWLRILPWAVAAVAVIATAALGVTSWRGPDASAAPVWTSIAAPVDRFIPFAGIAVSPDGQRMAFVARNASGNAHLWVRALDEQSARMLPATEGALAPFWSPDSQSIGFYRNSKYHTVSLAGGSPQLLTNTGVALPRGATWGRDGVILFVRGPGDGIYRVAASGGTAVSLGPASNAGASLSMFPSFLPDGRHFLYTSFRVGEWWINVGSLDSTTTTPLLKAFSKAEYANGHLLFGSNGALYAQPFDVATLALSGERMRVIDSLGGGPSHAANYAFSSAQNVIAADRTSAEESQLIWLDEKGGSQGALGVEGQISGVSVSRDRTKAVIVRNDPALKSHDPWIVALDTGFASAVRPGAEGSTITSPVWSADGRQIFFRDETGLRILSVSGGPDAHWPMPIHWPLSSSPDGQFLLIMAQATGTGDDLMLVPLTGDHTPVPYLRTSSNESAGRISPDGRSVAYVSNESGRAEVYVQPFPTAGNKTRISVNGGNSPEWSGDGRSVYFLSRVQDEKRAMMVARVPPGGAAPRRLFDMPPGSSGYAVFNDGRRFLTRVSVPETAPQVITVGQNWIAGLGKGR